MRALLWSYLGWRRFRRRARLGAAVQLGFVRMTGAVLDILDRVPRPVPAHVGQQLGLAAPELATPDPTAAASDPSFHFDQTLN